MRSRCLLLACLAPLLAACTATSQYDPATNDPLEPMNRGIHDFNRLADLLIIEPASRIYGDVLPDPVKTGVANFLDNLRAPIIFANDLFQGERDRAGTTLGRFMINTIVGIGGIFDPATALGHPKHDEDFGQTLAVYGVDEGPFLMLPFYGPSNPRDALGIVVDGFFLDPLVYLVPLRTRLVRTAVDGVNTRYELRPVFEDLEQNAIDQYATIRSVYRQQRASEILNGRAPPVDAYDDIFDEEFDDFEDFEDFDDEIDDAGDQDNGQSGD
jgi:phospholipid-binding lipoprotein MlaA